MDDDCDELKRLSVVDPSSSDGAPAPPLAIARSRDTFGSGGDELPAGGSSLCQRSRSESNGAMAAILEGRVAASATAAADTEHRGG